MRISKSFLLILIILCKAISSFSQRDCGSTFNKAELEVNDPQQYNRFMQHEQHVRDYKSSNISGARLINPNGLIIIPVVFHVIHKGETIGSGLNVSDEVLQRQISILNEDFRRLNADRINTPAVFASSATDIQIEFRLACFDPAGNFTSGILRKQTNNVSPFTNSGDEVKSTSSGGEDPWPTDKYLNIWICDLSVVLGYSNFPWNFNTNPAKDGVVVDYQAVGIRSGNFSDYNLGRTLTHEIGHWLGLIHIWGDDYGLCTGTDECEDTPNQSLDNKVCRTFPYISCGNGPNGDMFMNYMDYSPDACMNIFTEDQKNRMRSQFAVVNGVPGARSGFLNNYFGFINQAASITCKGKMTVSPMCLPVTWIITGPATISSGNGSNQIEISATGSGIVHLVATSGNYTAETDVSVTVGSPPYVTIDISTSGSYSELPANYTLSDYNSVCNYQNVNLNMYITAASTSSWSKVSSNPTNLYWEQTGNNLGFYFYNVGQSAQYRITATNSCGTTSKNYGFKSIDCSGGGGGCEVYAASPNPASESIDITVPNIPPPPPCDVTAAQLAQSDITEVTIYDQSGTMKRKLNYSAKTKKVHINLNGLKTGIYIFEIGNKAHKERKQVVVTQ